MYEQLKDVQRQRPYHMSVHAIVVEALDKYLRRMRDAAAS
jgi:hypothetical protein